MEGVARTASPRSLLQRELVRAEFLCVGKGSLLWFWRGETFVFSFLLGEEGPYGFQKGGSDFLLYFIQFSS